MNQHKLFWITRLVEIANKSHLSHVAIDRVLDRVNSYLDLHGVEAITHESAWQNYYCNIIALFVNSGDTYDTTVLFDVQEYKFYVTCYGDWLESFEQELEEQ